MLDRLPIRWRLAIISAGLTFLILLSFSIAIGQLTASRIRSDFNNEIAAAVDTLSDRLSVVNLNAGDGTFDLDGPPLDAFAAPNNAVIRVLSRSGKRLLTTRKAPNFGILVPRTTQAGGFRIETRERALPVRGNDAIAIPVFIQYARPISDVEATVDRVRFFLVLGIVGGTLLALVAGLLLARRAMSPVTALTAAARDIARTRNPQRSVPIPPTDDEVGELARTLDEMLRALRDAQEETEGMLFRQREFVADASHELRTPLTSVLANLDLLAEVLDGERGEAARSALRSSQRMRRLVADLLLLARADAKRTVPHEPTDLGQVLVDAAAELGPVADGHQLSVAAEPVLVAGARDELHRLALNLMENAIRHTPAGTRVHAAVVARDDEVILTVQDDGPGVPPDLHDRLFERFVRGSGDRGSSSGLGLSIVRTVADSHGGSVTLEDANPGARFVVRLPRVGERAVRPPAPAQAPDGTSLAGS